MGRQILTQREQFAFYQEATDDSLTPAAPPKAPAPPATPGAAPPPQQGTPATPPATPPAQPPAQPPQQPPPSGPPPPSQSATSGVPKIPGMPQLQIPGMPQMQNTSAPDAMPKMQTDYNSWQNKAQGAPLDKPFNPTRPLPNQVEQKDWKDPSLPSVEAAGITNVDYSHLPNGEPLTKAGPSVGGGGDGGAGSGSNSPGASGASGVGGAGQGGAGGGAAGGTPGGGAPSKDLSDALTRAGIDPAMHGLISGFSAAEGKNPSGAPTLGFTDGQAGNSLDSHAQALAKQIKDRQSVAGEFPRNGTPQQQASWMATVVGQNGSPSDWQGNAQPSRSDYINRIVQNMPGSAVGTAGASSSGGSSGQTSGADTHGQILPGTQAFQTSLQKQFPQVTNIGGYRAPDGYNEHSSGHALDVMIPDTATQNQVREWALRQPNVNFVLNQQQEWHPGQRPMPMPDRGGPTANHFDHLHINVAGDVQPAPGVQRQPPQTVGNIRVANISLPPPMEY